MEDLLNYDIENILLERTSAGFTHFLRVANAFTAFENRVMDSIHQQRNEEIATADKIEADAIIIVNGNTQIVNTESEKNDVLLQQKVVEKQIQNIMRQEERIEEEIAEEMKIKEDLALEIVDLEQDQEESRSKKKIKWEGLRRCCKPYKSILQIHLAIHDIVESYQSIRISFDLHGDTNKKYYADLNRTLSQWRMESTEPALGSKERKLLSSVVNFDNQCQVTNVTAFLCILRRIFQQNETKTQ